MRTMLLSFKPKWYNLIKYGSKIFEYRRTFPDEEIMAYMYVSSPMKQIVGKIHLGRKIDINTWKEKYKDDCGCKNINLLCKGSLKHCIQQLHKTPEEHIDDIMACLEYADKTVS